MPVFTALNAYKMGRHILFGAAILITLSSGTEAFLHRDNSADLGGHAPINWTSCGGNAIAVNPLYLTQCDKSNCTLKIYKGYPGKFYMTPSTGEVSNIINSVLEHTKLTYRYNHTYLNLYVTARSARTGRSLALLNTNGYEKEHYVMGNNFSLNFPLTFGKYFQTNWTNDLHTITVKVGSQEMEICRQFDVYLNSEVPNDGKEQGHGCWVVEAPCDFEHSVCVKNGNNATCRCDSLSVVGNDKCLKIIDVPCTTDGECLNHGECSNGYCRCKTGYRAHVKDKCSSGSALTASFLLLGFVEILTYLQYK